MQTERTRPLTRALYSESRAQCDHTITRHSLFRTRVLNSFYLLCCYKKVQILTHYTCQLTTPQLYQRPHGSMLQGMTAMVHASKNEGLLHCLDRAFWSSRCRCLQQVCSRMLTYAHVWNLLSDASPLLPSFQLPKSGSVTSNFT